MKVLLYLILVLSSQYVKSKEEFIFIFNSGGIEKYEINSNQQTLVFKFEGLLENSVIKEPISVGGRYIAFVAISKTEKKKDVYLLNIRTNSVDKIDRGWGVSLLENKNQLFFYKSHNGRTCLTRYDIISHQSASVYCGFFEFGLYMWNPKVFSHKKGFLYQNPTEESYVTYNLSTKHKYSHVFGSKYKLINYQEKNGLLLLRDENGDYFYKNQFGKISKDLDLPRNIGLVVLNGTSDAYLLISEKKNTTNDKIVLEYEYLNIHKNIRKKINIKGDPRTVS